MQSQNGPRILENTDIVYLEIKLNVPWGNTSTGCAARAGDAALVMNMVKFMKTQQYTASSLLNIFPSMS